jgi:uncharacterized Zn finger protein (UPF0148 family)
MAENPGNPNNDQLKELRDEVVSEEEKGNGRSRKEPIDRYEPHDRRTKRQQADPADKFKLDGAVDQHDRFSDDRAAHARQELTWMPMRVDL